MAISLVLTLCTVAACNSYDLESDTAWKTPTDCAGMLVAESDRFALVWKDTKALQAYFDSLSIKEEAHEMADYDFTCERVHVPGIRT